MNSFKLTKCKKYNGLLKSFILTFLAFIIIVVSSLLLYHKKKSNDYLQYLKTTENQTIKLEKSIIFQKLNSLYTDLLSIAKQNSLHNYLKSKSASFKKIANKDFIDFCRMKGIYDQIRFINNDGMEVFKINYSQSIPKIVTKNHLNLQKNRYYFTHTLSLKNKQIYISPLELFIENNKITQPEKPIMLVGTPVFDNLNIKQGIIVINYLATDILSSINNFARLSSGNIMLLNSNGYWLLGADNSKDNMGFMYKDKSNKKFSTKYPTAWKQIVKTDSVQLITNEGLFTSTTIPLSNLFKQINSNPHSKFNSLLENKLSLNHKGHYWKLISFIPKKDFISNNSKHLSQYLSWLGRILLILAIIPSFLIAYAITKIKYKQLELYRMANFDKLTSLPNRKYFFDILQKTVKIATKGKTIFALLYIDIDNFKSINDTHGHEQGDYILQETAKRFINSIHHTDFVARIGGDEFVIILKNIKTEEDSKLIAKRLLDIFSEPFLLNHEEFQVSISIGISTFSKDNHNDSILLKQADKAMYKAKKSGKNTFKFFNDKHKS